MEVENSNLVLNKIFNEKFNLTFFLIESEMYRQSITFYPLFAKYNCGTVGDRLHIKIRSGGVIKKLNTKNKNFFYNKKFNQYKCLKIYLSNFIEDNIFVNEVFYRKIIKSYKDIPLLFS